MEQSLQQNLYRILLLCIITCRCLAGASINRKLIRLHNQRRHLNHKTLNPYATDIFSSSLL